MCSIKKDLSIVPKLSPRIIMIDKNCAVIGYASGKNEHLFMQLVDNGMFVITKIDGDEALIVDGNEGSDDDNEVLGAVSEASKLMCWLWRSRLIQMISIDGIHSNVVV